MPRQHMELQYKMRHLSEVTAFQNMSRRELEELDRMTTMKTVSKGRIFYQPDEPTEVLFILKKGRVQLYRLNPHGKKLVIATLGCHSMFGEMAMLGAKMNNTFAEGVEDCLICVMSHNDLERMILANPHVALHILENNGLRLRDAEARLEDLAFKGVSARMAGLLLRLAEETGPGANVIEGFTHLDLAESIGTYRETATQVLNDFKSAGLIEISRKRISILDRSGLASVDIE
jgi:CRP/FNR family transcriptional regulator, cyclic AMP receptor protein